MAKKSLLLVDADSKSLRMLEVSLRKSGFSVTTAVHAADAREKLKHAAPDLIITDTKLPGDESGFDFVGKLKSKTETANIPIIFLSSENRLEQKVAGLELGVEDYLTKPIYIKEVLTRVRVLLDKREKQTLERRERSSSFAGLLGEMGLVDLMQTVEIGRKTGKLFIENRLQRGQVSFREGKVCDARSGRLSGERAFYRMLVWNDGTFSMEFSAHDDADVIELSTQGLLMEGMRRVDEWGRLIEQLPPLEHRFEIDFTELVDRLAEIPDEINALLRLFDGRRTLIEVVDETDFGDLEALEIASKLYFEGLIFDVADREPVASEGAHRVEAWLQEPGPTTGSGVEDDADDGGLLVPNDTMPPQPASAAPGERRLVAPATAATGFLAPPTGASEPTIAPTTAALSTLPKVRTPALGRMTDYGGAGTSDDDVTIPEAPSVATMLPSAAKPTSTRASLPPSTLPTTTKTSAEPARPRPLPGPGAEGEQARSVLPRAAVGARAWSTKDGGEAGFDISDDDTEGARRSVMSPTSEAITHPAEPSPLSTESDQDSDEGDPLESSLARDLGLSRDELKLALAAGASRPPQPAAAAVDAVSPATPDLAQSIADQLDAAEDPADDDTARRAIGADDATLTELLRQPPLPTPMTSTPSLFVSNEPTPVAREIHNQPTKLDAQAPEAERSAVSRPMAAAIFVVGFLVVLGVVLIATRETPIAVVDAGVGGLHEMLDGGRVDEIVIVADAGEIAATTATTATTPATSTTTPTTTKEIEPEVDAPTPPGADTPEAQYARHLKVAEGLANRGDFGRSVRSYKSALSAMPNGLAAHLGLGNAYYELDSLPAALKHLEKARALAPKDPQVYVLLGAAYQSSNRTADAVTAYERYLVLAPDGKFARDVRGILRGIKR